MPELPEVETTVRGIAPFIEGAQLQRLIVRNSALRWPIPHDLATALNGVTITRLRRRAKYLLVETTRGEFLLHLGMSGSLRWFPLNLTAGAPQTEPGKHDHIDFCFADGILRFNDPRRFGALLPLTLTGVDGRPVGSTAPDLLSHLGPEPLSNEFNGDLLFARSRGRKVAVKNFIMDSRIVVGVGNIYAAEALFASGIHPLRAAGRISRRRYDRLATAIRSVLGNAIVAGGTTLRDFTGGDGKPGYFSQSLAVYGRQGEACPSCGSVLKLEIIGARSSVYCGRCQR